MVALKRKDEEAWKIQRDLDKMRKKYLESLEHHESFLMFCQHLLMSGASTKLPASCKVGAKNLGEASLALQATMKQHQGPGAAFGKVKAEKAPAGSGV